MAQALLLVAALALCAQAALAVRSDERTFAMIAASGSTAQWRLTLTRGKQNDPARSAPLTCASPVMNACFSFDKPDPMTPFTVLSDEVMEVQYTWRNDSRALKTFRNGKPTKIAAKLCYSTESALDRPWRKKNKAYPRLSKNCIVDLGSRPFTGDVAQLNSSFVFPLDKDSKVTTATWFMMLQITCEDGEVCAFESTETKPSGHQNFVQTESYNPVTPELMVASIILSIIGPVIFFVYFGLDMAYYKKTGKALQPTL